MRIRLPLVTLLVASILLGLGCTTTKINPGTETSATYKLGALRATLDANMDASYKAAEAAAQELGLSVVQRVQDKLESQLAARDAQDKKILIKLLAVTADTTNVSIHVSSPDKASRIYQTILNNIKK